MKLLSYQLLDFANPKSAAGEHAVAVPAGSILLDLTVMHQGIYTWYLVPELHSTESINEKFLIVRSNQPVPYNTKFIKILDTLVDVPPEKEGDAPGVGMVVFPIFKVLEDSPSH